MNYYKLLFKNVLIELKRNKVRAGLTSIGITIGVLAVVLLTAIGLGLKNYISQQFENLGANIIAIFPGSGITGGFGSTVTSIKFDQEDLRSIQRIPELDYVVPGYIANVTFESKVNNHRGTLIGTSHEYAELFALKFIDGSFFSASDVKSKAKVGVLAENLAEDLFDDPNDAVGRTVIGRGIRFKVVGVVGKVGNPQRDRMFFIPYSTGFTEFSPKKEFFLIYTGVSDSDQVQKAKRSIEQTLTQKYDEDEFEPLEAAEVVGSINEIFGMINVIVVAIGSISLLVGGIGIMNIMYANVTERTKEIGIRRAIGATKKDILMQFLAESVMLSGFGGILGLLISIGIVAVVRPFFPIALNVFSVIAAVGISAGIGIFFGVFPARRAANLTPIEAIRYE